MECTEHKEESHLIITQHETLNKNDIVTNDTKNNIDENGHVHLESLVQTEDCCNLINTETCLESNNASTINNTVHTFSQLYVSVT